MVNKDAMTLIQRYLEAVAQLTARLAKAYGVESLFLARRDGKIPRSGSFGDGGEFQFHGIGCNIDDGFISVNFDFFADGRTDGFDAWRLHTFAEDNSVAKDLALDTSRAALARQIEGFVRMGYVVPVLGSNLFMLTEQAARGPQSFARK